MAPIRVKNSSKKMAHKLYVRSAELGPIGLPPSPITKLHFFFAWFFVKLALLRTGCSAHWLLGALAARRTGYSAHWLLGALAARHTGCSAHWLLGTLAARRKLLENLVNNSPLASNASLF